MKKVTLLLFAFLFGAIQANAQQEQKMKDDASKITILDGAVVLEISSAEIQKSDDFHCMGFHLFDKNISKGLGTCLEMKRKGEFYIVEIEYKYKQFRSIEDGIEAYLKDVLKKFHQNKKYSKKVWKAFVKEGGLQSFINISKEYIDEEFLTSPFNEIYG